MKNTTIATIFSVACAAVAIYLGCELSNERKASKEKEERYNVDLDKVTDEVSGEVERGVHDRVIHDAIEKYAERKVTEFLEKGSNKAVENTKNLMNGEISRRVDAEWGVMKGEIRDKILAKVDRFDISKLKDDATEAARDKLVDDLSDKLDELAEKMNDKYEERAEKLLDAYEKRIKDKMQYRYGMFF